MTIKIRSDPYWIPYVNSGGIAGRSMREWCKLQGGTYIDLQNYQRHSYIKFEKESDATMFMLKWSNK